MKRFLVLALLLLPLSLWAGEVYKTTDEQGNTIYTDNPPAGEKNEKVTLPETNVQPAVQFKAKRSASSQSKSQALPYRVRLTSPQDGTTLGPAESTLVLSADTNQALESGLALLFLRNGEALGPPTTDTARSLPLSLKMRGRSTFEVQIVNLNSGEVIASSEPVTVYVIRPGRHKHAPKEGKK